VDVTKLGLCPKDVDWIHTGKATIVSDICEYMDVWLTKLLDSFRSDSIW